MSHLILRQSAKKGGGGKRIFASFDLVNDLFENDFLISIFYSWYNLEETVWFGLFLSG
ncbi:MAG TPA: hypothetical protein VMH01_06490 [Puia sp.]|nr:hypothetical protein [Puia sp.]